ncbi:MAG: exosortase/archaeosortase family protein [Deltaproteobacteria bacterium]|nr:exosortase/archaeosortase family protein [Deltaproteobacteria bacterium]MBW2361437.1 exosortase/archaeosortase family protein [Deltaproteobacteria bacterium]
MTLRDAWLPALLLVVFAPALAAMASVWSSVDHYSHGFLVPLVSFAALGRAPRRLPSFDRRGLVGLALSLAVYVAGLVAGSVTLQGLALVGAVAGGVVLLFGSTGLRRWAFPVGFLVFMVPLPAPLITPLILELQFWVSAVAVALLRAGGVPVLREGNVLELPGGESLFVAEACSGITSLVTLVPLAVALAYFAHRRFGRRACIVLAALPAALAFNLLRAVATVAAVRRFGGEVVIESPLHEMAGLVTFSLACLTLVALSAVLGRRQAPA